GQGSGGCTMRDYPVRILSHEIAALGSRLHPVVREPICMFRSAMGQRKHALAMTLVGAERVFGRSSRRFDPDKGSFRFPLWLSAARDGFQLRYFLDLRDTRGTVHLEAWRFGPP